MANSLPSNVEPTVPPGTRVYAVGDIHGCVERLTQLHAAILEDARTAPGRRVVVYLGDYVDRGEGSKAVIDLLLDQALPGFERVHLKGNHEDFLLRALRDRRVILSWLANGGDATCRAYGVKPEPAPAGLEIGLGTLQSALAAALPPRHRSFFDKLAVRHEEGDYFFCHAGVRPGVPLQRQREDDLLWIREPFLSDEAPLEKVVVHGHTPTWEPVCRANRIGIDTGAVYGGKLTALVLEGTTRRFLEA